MFYFLISRSNSPQISLSSLSLPLSLTHTLSLTPTRFWLTKAFSYFSLLNYFHNFPEIENIFSLSLFLCPSLSFSHRCSWSMEEELHNPEESWFLWARIGYPIGWSFQCGLGGDPGTIVVDLMMVGFAGTWVMKMVSGGCRVVVGGNDLVVVRQHTRRCSFTSRLAWEASRYRATMGLLTWWRSR